MQIIKCTKKLQKEMGLKKSELSVNDSTESIMGSWHANLLYILGKKCVLFVNDVTLFNFIVTGITRDQIKDLSSMFTSNLRCVLLNEGIDEALCNNILDECTIIEYKNTDNRSVLGSINDLAYHYKAHIQDEGSLHTAQIPDIIKRLNHMPMGALKFVYAIDTLKERLKNAT